MTVNVKILITVCLLLLFGYTIYQGIKIYLLKREIDNCNKILEYGVMKTLFDIYSNEEYKSEFIQELESSGMKHFLYEGGDFYESE